MRSTVLTWQLLYVNTFLSSDLHSWIGSEYLYCVYTAGLTVHVDVFVRPVWQLQNFVQERSSPARSEEGNSHSLAVHFVTVLFKWNVCDWTFYLLT